jgi:hypothetical protein
MDPIRDWFVEDRGRRAAEALKKREFNAHYVENQEKAKEMILKEVPPGATVGVGGSVTIRGLKVLEALKARGHKVLDHWEIPREARDESFQVRRAQQTSDVFLASTNAVTLDGQLVNTDGAGNRVNGMVFGPRKAIVVAGVNKIVANLESALRRIKEVAVPLNCRRLNINPPACKRGNVLIAGFPSERAASPQSSNGNRRFSRITW